MKMIFQERKKKKHLKPKSIISHYQFVKAHRKLQNRKEQEKCLVQRSTQTKHEPSSWMDILPTTHTCAIF